VIPGGEGGDWKDDYREAAARLRVTQEERIEREAIEFDGDDLPTESLPRPDGLVVVGADDFAAWVFPPREILLGPFFEEKNLGLLFALRGTGKTLVGVGIALAVASGGAFLRWKAPRPRRVLYVDGELPRETLQKRLKDVSATTGLPISANLRLLTPDLQPEGVRLPDLGTPAGQEALLELIEREKVDLLILDNLSTLVRNGIESEAEAWQPIQDWLILLRSRKVSVLMLHHTDKARGDQRGTSKREDVLDFSIKLARPEDYQMEHGARFEIHFSKARDLLGSSVIPFEAPMEAATWSVKDISEAAKAERAEAERANRLSALGNEVEGFLKKAGRSTVNTIADNVEGRKQDIIAALRGLRARGVADWEPGKHSAQLWRIIRG